MRPLVLSGFMGVGKSTVGPRLAARLAVPFVDTDDLIAREAGASVPDLWRRDGEAAFRARERELIARLLAEPTAQVIAFGGGAVTQREVRHLALEQATLVTLTASAETILARTSDISARPNLGVPTVLAAEPGDMPARRLTRIEDLLASRADAYAECHGAVATDRADPDATVASIQALAARDAMVVPLGLRSYVIEMATGDGGRVAEVLAEADPSHVIAVTDANVARLRGQALDAILAKVRHTKVTLPPGEMHKTLASVSLVWDAALGAGIDRRAVVLAFGGGVVGDMAGFAAATLLRGIRFVQVPTTLLSMVDASVGGKTGFDHPLGKNLLGAFHQPRAVVIDLDHLATLPARERTAGLAEVVKIALVADGELLDAMERTAPALAAGDPAALAPIVRRAVAAKVRIVRDDEQELGARALLNLGHTVGHALEAYGGYARYLHGEAVAIGTVEELRIGTRLGHTPAALAERAHTLLARLGLPTETAAGELTSAWAFVATDKKRVGTAIRLPVVTAAGTAHVERVELDAARKALDARYGAGPAG
jgi:shikimate kinase/3-dehydroquinate synthase